VHDPADTSTRGRPHDRLGAANVYLEELEGVRGTERVDARHMEDELATAHGLGERVLVAHVAAGDLEAAPGQRLRGGVRASERHDRVASLAEPLRQRAADEPAGAGDEYPRHGVSATRRALTA
jgi:hypothetical protein